MTFKEFCNPSRAYRVSPGRWRHPDTRAAEYPSRRDADKAAYARQGGVTAAEVTAVSGSEPEAPRLRLSQIIAAPFANERGASYSLIGLGVDGCVYRYDPQCQGWIAWSMEIADCRDRHPGRR